MLGDFQILHDGAAGDDSTLQMFHAKALETLCAKMFQQFLPCVLVGKYPLIHFKHTVALAETALKILLVAALIEHFLGHEVAQQFLHIIVCTLPGEERSEEHTSELQSRQYL